MPLVAFTSAQPVTAAQLNLLQPIYVPKPSNQSVNNSSVLVNDTALFVALQANQTYQVDAFILASHQNTTATLPQLRSAWTLSLTGTSPGRFVSGSTDGVGSFTSWSQHQSQDRFFVIGTNNLNVLDVNANLIRETVIVAAGNSGTTLQYQFAQFTVNAANSVSVLASSFLVARCIA